MRHLPHRIRVVVICVLVTVVVVVSVGDAAAQNPLRPAEAVVVNAPTAPVPTVAGAGVMHLGVPVADHVMLVGVGSSGACGALRQMRRMLPDGTVEPNEFVVPGNRSLVVLDVDAVIVTDDLNYFPVGHSVGASLVTPANTNTGVFMAHTTPGVLLTVAGMKAVSVSSSLAAGVVFGPGQQVCVRPEVRGFGGGFLTSQLHVSNTMVRGYLR